MIITAEMEIDDEEWRPIVSRGATFSRYLISNYGRVIGPRGKRSTGKVSGMYKGLDIHMTPEEIEEYPQFTNYFKGNVRIINAKIHGLVAETFMPIKDNLPSEWADVRFTLKDSHFYLLQRLYNIDHINGEKHDNRVANLRYVTAYQNNTSVKKKLLNQYETNTEFGT